VIDPFSEEGDLSFDGACVFGITAEFGEDPGLFLSSDS
jgi:hypothetical protein